MIDFDIAGLTVSCVLEELDSVISVHSGRALLRGKGSISVPEHRMNDVLSFIEASDTHPTTGLLRRARTTTGWRLSRGAYSYGTGTASIEIGLTEFEALVAEAISIDSTKFELLAYQEKMDGPGIAAKAIIRVPLAMVDAVHRFHSENSYHAVVRHGISDQPTQMRFGAMPVWSQHDGFAKYGISLFDERSDRQRTEGERKPRPLFLREAAVADELAYRIELMEALMSLLIDKRVLSKEEIEALRQEATKTTPIRRALFPQVDDVEDYEL